MGGFQHVDADAVAIHNANGSYSLELSEGFSVLGAFHHYFTPQFHDILFGSYEEVNYGKAKNIAFFNGGIGNASEYRIGNQFVYTPVHNLDVGLEFLYAHIDQDIAGTTKSAPQATQIASKAAFAAAKKTFKIDQNPDAFVGRLRIERDF